MYVFFILICALFIVYCLIRIPISWCCLFSWCSRSHH
uniref:Uncharacterized protein n=1 Tax=Anguilla anguilla TaxID=7936 RepID=A0A0E9VCB6_ANGAN